MTKTEAESLIGRRVKWILTKEKLVKLETEKPSDHLAKKVNSIEGKIIAVDHAYFYGVTPPFNDRKMIMCFIVTNGVGDEIKRTDWYVPIENFSDFFVFIPLEEDTIKRQLEFLMTEMGYNTKTSTD